MVAEILQKLEVYSDSEFKFDPIKHKYHYQGQHFISVTQFISRFHKEFDTEYWSKKKAEDRGVDQTEVLNEWKKLNDRANEIGTATHNWIENYFNRIYQELPSDLDVIDRINKFNVAFAKHLHKLTPVKFLTDESDRGRHEKLLYPFQNYYKNHLNEYSIQVSLYKLILREIGIDVKSCYLLYLGPEKEAQIYKAHDFSSILDNYFMEEQIKNLYI